MAKPPVTETSKPGKRRPEGEEDYLALNLSMLTRFRLFIAEVVHADGPVSFRFFMKGRGSHRTMALTVDAIESRAKQLMIRRQILDDDGSKTANFKYEYDEAKKPPTRRPGGVSPRDITPHGFVWAELGGLVDDLFIRVMDDGSDPGRLLQDLRTIRDELARLRADDPSIR